MSFDPEAAGWSARPPAGFAGLTGPFWTRAEGDSWAYGILAEDRHTNPKGIVHGGMILTLLDNSMGLAVWRATNNRPHVTMQLNTQFIAAAHPGEFLEGRGEVLRITRSVVFVRGKITVGDRLVAAGDGIWKGLVRRGQGES